jgi:hypothetical protein
MPMPPTLTPQELVAKWRGDTRKEPSISQEHFIDLCRLLGHETPGENRDGTLAFEAGADKQKGGQGWADVWKQGAFAWEYKGPHADLPKAYQQIQQYREHPTAQPRPKGRGTMRVTTMTRRIAIILLLEPDLDTNYQVIIATTSDWSNITA